jgi:DNA-binding CsgD family transcriptional regulator/ligand-binding sensor domain-containing protein
MFVALNALAQTNSLQLRGIPLRTHFDSEDYRAGMQSWDFSQSEDGLLYVANNSGLLEFDGNKWKKYDIPDATKIRTVMIDSKGVVYVGGQNQIGFFINTGSGFQFKTLRDELDSAGINISEIWKIFEYEGKIYFNAEDKLITYSTDGIEEINSPGFLINSFMVDERLICQFYGLGLFELQNGKFLPLPNTESLTRLVAIYKNDQAYIFISEFGDVYEYDSSGIDLKTKLLDPVAINDVLKLKNGDYAIGTQNKGLLILDSEFSIKLHLTKNKGITDRTVKAVYQDNFNNLWVALNNGIDYLKISLPFNLINEELGIEGTGYDARYFDKSIYLGTNNGLFLQKDINVFSDENPFELIPGSEGQVYKISQIDNELFLNHHKGAFMLDGQSLEQIHDIGSWTFEKTSKPNLILGGDYKGIKYFEKKNDTWIPTGDILGLTESSRILVFENDTILWMSHGYRGVYRLELDKNMQLKDDIKHFNKRHGFPSNILISAYKLDGKMIFTSEHGIYNFNPKSLEFSKNAFFDEVLGDEHVSNIKSNGHNSIYYIQNAGFGVIKEEKYGKFSKETSLFKHINKYISDDLQNISVFDKNNILITAKNGFIHFDPSKKHGIKKDFSTVIRSVKASKIEDSTFVNIPVNTKELVIDKNQSIKIEYASPYYDGFEDLNYSYRLKPLDEKWSKWSSLNEKSYDHLPFGDYTFEVKALNIYGMESKVSEFSFEVLTPWYATWTGRIVYISILLIIIVMIPILQRRKYKAETSIITEQKKKELKIKDEQIDKLYSEKLQTELNLKNDQLTSITMQLVKNKEFIQSVQDKLSSTLDKGGSAQELKRIINSIDQELSDEDYWDKFAYHFDQVHGNYLEKLSSMDIKLSPREIKLAAFLRMNMSSKEIAKLLNITTRGVELARYRLRKKLKLEREQNLVEYLIELDNT